LTHLKRRKLPTTHVVKVVDIIVNKLAWGAVVNVKVFVVIELDHHLLGLCVLLSVRVRLELVSIAALHNEELVQVNAVDPIVVIFVHNSVSVCLGGKGSKTILTNYGIITRLLHELVKALVNDLKHRRENTNFVMLVPRPDLAVVLRVQEPEERVVHKQVVRVKQAYQPIDDIGNKAVLDGSLYVRPEALVIIISIDIIRPVP